jgi:hypothetical protein
LKNRKRIGVAAALVGAVVILAAIVALTSRPAAAASAKAASVGKLIFAGTTSGTVSGSRSTADGTSTESSPASEGVDEDVPNSGTSGARVPSSGVPTPRDNGVAAPGSEKLSDFVGLNHADERFAGTDAYKGTQFSLEPPDQALCVGNGFAVESVNDAVGFYSTTSGSAVGDPIALNQFFNLSPAVIRATATTPAVFGDFTSDPKCLYDSANGGHFILTILQAGTIPMDGPNVTGGSFDGTGHVEIAVSRTNNPTGTWDLYNFSDSADGGSSCPCLGDQPLIGADANGFYVTTNSFPFFSDGFNGAQVYAMSKNQLETRVTPAVINVPVPTPADFGSGGIPYSLQPAKTAPGAADASNTEYFLSALDFNATLDNRIALWTLTGTDTLDSGSPSLQITGKTISSEVYGQPPSAQQSSAGPFPLRDFLGVNPQLALFGFTFDKSQYHTELLNSNDDRMNEVMFDGHKLYGAVNTVVKTPNGPTHTGIAWFVVDPATSTIPTQGYLVANKENLLFPAFGVNASGKGAMGVTIVGTDMHPSTAYAMFDGSRFGPLHISFAGPVANDGFTGYENILKSGKRPGNQVGTARWGDYGATAVDSDGSIWLANETTSTTRSTLANWGTHITHVQP